MCLFPHQHCIPRYSHSCPPSPSVTGTCLPCGGLYPACGASSLLAELVHLHFLTTADPLSLIYHYFSLKEHLYLPSPGTRPVLLWCLYVLVVNILRIFAPFKIFSVLPESMQPFLISLFLCSSILHFIYFNTHLPAELFSSVIQLFVDKQTFLMEL